MAGHRAEGGPAASRVTSDQVMGDEEIFGARGGQEVIGRGERQRALVVMVVDGRLRSLR